jgi:hypothetical protein
MHISANAAATPAMILIELDLRFCNESGICRRFKTENEFAQVESGAFSRPEILGSIPCAGPLDLQ